MNKNLRNVLLLSFFLVICTASLLSQNNGLNSFYFRETEKYAIGYGYYQIDNEKFPVVILSLKTERFPQFVFSEEDAIAFMTFLSECNRNIWEGNAHSITFPNDQFIRATCAGAGVQAWMKLGNWETDIILDFDDIVKLINHFNEAYMASQKIVRK